MVGINMSMPKDCRSCLFLRNDSNFLKCIARNKVGREVYKEFVNRRQLWCPLVEVNQWIVR